jgi:hypothetical protein
MTGVLAEAACTTSPGHALRPRPPSWFVTPPTRHLQTMPRLDRLSRPQKLSGTSTTSRFGSLDLFRDDGRATHVD